MYSEDEAKTKWCPFARFVPNFRDVAVPAGNRFAPNTDVGATFNSDCRCIASECMAGNRFAPNTDVGATFNSDCRCIASECMAWRWEEPYHPGSSARFGRCGLAGEL